MKAKNKKRYRWKRNRLFVVIFLLVIVLFYWIQGLTRFIEPRLQAYARQYVVAILNEATQQMLSKLSYEGNKLYEIVYGANHTISNIQYNSYYLNQILYDALVHVGDKGNYIVDKEEGGEIRFLVEDVNCKIPIGYFTKIPILLNKGFEISIPFQIMNDVTGDIDVQTQPYGLNNTLLTIGLNIRITSQVITLFEATQITTEHEIPLVVQVIQGRVPDYMNTIEP